MRRQGQEAGRDLIDAIAECKSDVHLVIAGKLRNENWDKYENQIANKKIIG